MNAVDESRGTIPFVVGRLQACFRVVCVCILRFPSLLNGAFHFLFEPRYQALDVRSLHRMKVSLHRSQRPEVTAL